MSIEKLGMPKWGLSMTEGRVIEWLVEEGADLDIGTEVAEVETEKINGAVESPAAGVLRRRVAAEGDVIPVGGLLGVIADASVSDADIDSFVADFQASFVPAEAEEEAGPAPETVTVGGTTLRFLKTGEGGEPLVLLHGFGGDLNNWLFNVEALSGDRAVYSLDLPGHGGSSKDVGDGDLAALCGALRGFLDSQGIDKVHLVGHSMGGLVAATVALEDPARVASLTLVDSAGLGEQIDRDYIEGFVAAEGRRDLKPVLQRLFADERLVTRQMVDDVLKYKRLDGVNASLKTLRAALFPEGRQGLVLKDQLADVKVPIRVLWGGQDRIVPAAHAQGLPSSVEVTIFADAGHLAHMEKANEVNAAIEAVLGRAA